MLLMQRSQAIIHFKAGSLEDAAKKGKHLKHRVGRGHITGICRASLQRLRWCRPPPCYQKPALWPWPASQEQMVARPEVKFDLNAEIQNSKSTRIALLKIHPPHILSPARTTVGGEALR